MNRSNIKTGNTDISPNNPNKQVPKKTWATMNRRYHLRFLVRFEMLLLVLCIYVFDREQYDLFFHHFFQSFTLLHLVWFYILWEMVLQALPLSWMPTGCMKQFAFRYEPVPDHSDQNERKSAKKTSDAEDPSSGENGKTVLKKEGKAASKRNELLQLYRRSQDRRAFCVLICWYVLNSFWWVLFLTGRFTEAECFTGSVLYTVFDLICILWFCPFQLIFMNTRCCSTCRVFNYGQIFTVTPILLIPSFASISLVAVAVIIFLQWEIKWHLHPERFYEGTNLRLNCSHCSEQLCVSRNKFYRRFHIPFPGRNDPGLAKKN